MSSRIFHKPSKRSLLPGLMLCALTIPFAHPVQAAPQTIVEFYNPNIGIGHYFITNPSEAAILDEGGGGGGWRRTGKTFQASDTATGGYEPVFRFYTQGANSHFYTFEGSEEYGMLLQQNPQNILHPNLWTAEGRSFNIKKPLNNACPGGTRPVYRLYNNRAAERDSNHRFTVEQAVVNQMLSQGWVMDGVAMCADPEPSYPSVSGLVSTTQGRTLSTTDGAEVVIPVGAVAPTPNGDIGATTVTLARVNEETVSLPPGTTLASNVYQLTPSGHVFQTAVAVTLPLNVHPGIDETVQMYIQNDNGELEDINGIYDPVTNTVTGQTRHFSFPYAVIGPRQMRSGYGCIRIDNRFASRYNAKNFCVTSVNRYDDPHSGQIPPGGIANTVSGPTDAMCGAGICDSAAWNLPAGNYNVCVESYDRNSQLESPRFIESKMFNNVSVQVGGNDQFFGANCRTSLSVGTLTSPVSNEYCSCSGKELIPTPGGTGTPLEISLLWQDAAGVDLDIYVTEPSGETINYENMTSNTGGRLDWDNQCYGYENGRTENVSWASPPSGTYRIEVDYYDKCSASAKSPINFKINITKNGHTSSYEGTVRDQQKVRVTEITFP